MDFVTEAMLSKVFWPGDGKPLGENAERTLANVPDWKRLETIGLYTHDSTQLKTIEITST